MALSLEYLSDYIEIRNLCAKYNRLADIGDGENYAKLFTEDAEFNIVGNRVYRGRAEIASAASATKVTVHVTTDPLIEIDGDTARQSSRNMSFYRAPDCSKNDFVATGWYIDELVRTSEGWLIKSRRVELDLTIPEVFRKMTITESFAKLAEA